jgi:hypothetical protein
VELRELNLGFLETVTVTLGLRLPCTGNTTWTVEAKQSNDFSGLPGNTLGPLTADSVLTTPLNGRCRLRFAPGPANAEAGAQIRAVEYAPPEGPLVKVLAVDGTDAGVPLTWFTGPVTLSLLQAAGDLTAGPGSIDSQGITSFPVLSIKDSGSYNLVAETTAAGVDDGTSGDFKIIGDVGRCGATDCRAQVAGRDSSSTLTGSGVTETGFALLSLNLGTPPDCSPAYEPPTSDWYEFELTVDGDKTVQASYSKNAMRTVSGPTDLQICFASPESFTAQGGTRPFDYDGDPLNGAEGFVGLLPIGCPTVPTGPCVMSRNGTTGGGAIVTFFVPRAWGDPRFR